MIEELKIENRALKDKIAAFQDNYDVERQHMRAPVTEIDDLSPIYQSYP